MAGKGDGRNSISYITAPLTLVQVSIGRNDAGLLDVKCTVGEAGLRHCGVAACAVVTAELSTLAESVVFSCWVKFTE